MSQILDIVDVAPFGLDFDVPDEVWVIAEKNQPRRLIGRAEEPGFIAVWLSEDESGAYIALHLMSASHFSKRVPIERLRQAVGRSSGVAGLTIYGVIVFDGYGNELGRRYFR